MEDFGKCDRSRRARAGHHGCSNRGRRGTTAIGFSFSAGLGMTIVLLIGIATGCGDRDGPTEPNETEPADTVAILEPGGIVTGVDGVVVGASEGALDQSVEIFLSQTDDPTVEVPFPEYMEGARVIGDFYQVSASGDVATPHGKYLALGFPIPDAASTDNLAIAVLSPSTPTIHQDSESDPSLRWDTYQGYYDDGNSLLVTTIPWVGSEPTVYAIVDNVEYIQPDVDRVDSRFDVVCVEFSPSRRCQSSDVEQTRDALDDMYDVYVTTLGFEKGPRLRHAVIEIRVDLLGTVIVETHEDRYEYQLRPWNRDEDDPGGWYKANEKVAITYFGGGTPLSDRTTRHELFHALQFGYETVFANLGAAVFGLIEGTARVAETEASFTSLIRSPADSPDNASRRPRVIDEPLLYNAVNQSSCDTFDDEKGEDVPVSCAYDYAAQDFWVYLGKRLDADEDPQVNYLIPLFERGGLRSDLDEWLGDEWSRGRAPFRRLADAYWNWAKNQAFEKEVRLGEDYHGQQVPRGLWCAWSGHGDAGAIVYAPGDPTTASLDALSPLTSKMVEITLEPAEKAYQAMATITSSGADPNFLNFKFYELDEAGTNACWDNPENTPHRFWVQEDPVKAYVLVSNAHMNDPSGQIAFQLEIEETLTGHVIDQFTNSPVPGVNVTSTEGAGVTDLAGQFVVAVDSQNDDLEFSSPEIHTRRTFGQGSDLDWRVIPADFDMDLFDEVARSLGDLIAVAENDRTHKWTGGSPRVFIDTRNHEDDPKYAPGDLPQQIRPHVAEYIGRWSAGTVSPEDVILTDSPPADGTEGTIVIRFVDLSHLRQEEDGETIWALAQTSPWAFWDRYEIVAGVIELDLVSSGLNMDPRLVVGREIGHIFGMGQFHRDRPFMMRAVTPPPGTEFSEFEGKVADIVYSRFPGTRSPDTEERPAAGVAPRAHAQPVGAPFLSWVRQR